MKTKEFNLSERKIEKTGMYIEEDVKEFIRILKKELHLTIEEAGFINKLAGDKLK